MNGKIYEITNLLDGKRYFGQTTKSYASMRWSGHAFAARRGDNTRLYNAIRKYGIRNFQFKVIVDGIFSQAELNRLERVWIETCGTTFPNQGYNICEGGGSTGEMPEEVKRKISLANKGNKNFLGKKHTPETKAKQSAAQKQRPHPPIPEEVKKKISAALLGFRRPAGRKLSEQHKANVARSMREHWKNKVITEEHRANLVAAARRRTQKAKLYAGSQACQS